MSLKTDHRDIDWTGERYVPWVDLVTPEIHYEHLHRYLFASQFVEGKNVLDLASGEGYGCAILAAKAKTVVGVDIDEEAVRHSAGCYKAANISFICGSITDVPVKGEDVFDVITCFEALEHIDDHERILGEVNRLLSRDGIFIVSTPNKPYYEEYSGGANPFHLKELSFADFEDLLDRNFRYAEVFGQRIFPVSSLWPLGEDAGEFRDFCVSKMDQGFSLASVQQKVPLYLIGVASQKPWETKLFSTLTDVDGEMFNSFRRIINSRDGELSDKQRIIGEKDEVIARLQLEKEDAHNLLSVTSSELHRNVRIRDEQRLVMNEQRLVIDEQRQHLQYLSERERQLEHVLQSRGWRLLSALYRIEDRIAPLNSKRRFLLKLMYKTLRNPRRALSGLNRRRIANFFAYLRSRDMDILEAKIAHRFSPLGGEQTKINLFLQDIQIRKIVFPKYEFPSVSIIVPVYNEWRCTYSCLKSIYENTTDIPYEVIVADDASPEYDNDVVDCLVNIVLSRNQDNVGFLLNCNKAAELAKGKYILFLNNDTNVQKDWLCSLLSLIESDDDIGMVGSKLVYPDGRLQEAGGIIWRDGSGWNYGNLDDPDKPEYNYVKQVDYISGACIMIRSDLWHKIQGFDERYVPAYFEDTDLAFQVRESGCKVVYQPKSLVVHFEGVSHGRDASKGVKAYQVRNATTFVEKWKDVLDSEHFDNSSNVFCARDRSAKSKTLLFIDHYVPQYDKDTGSRASLQYLSLFCKMGMNVKFVPDNFYRNEPYVTNLQQMGIEVLYGDWYSRNIRSWIENNGKYIDYAVLSRPHIAPKYIDMIRASSNCKIIYLGHDLHYLREMREYEITHDPRTLQSSANWKAKEYRLFSESDSVYYFSQVEIDEIHRHLPGLKATAVPLYMFDTVPDNLISFESREDLLFVGGFSHKPNIDAMLWFVGKVLPLIIDQLPCIKIYIVGSNPPNEITDLENMHVEVTGFVSDEDLENYYRHCRIAVVPLRYGAGVKGKVIEAMYRGVPVVTTSIGAEGLAAVGRVLVIADGAEEMARRIIEAYSDEGLLMSLSKTGTEYVRQNFTVRKVLDIIGDDFEYRPKDHEQRWSVPRAD